jgi:hypothetical protein
LSIKLLVIIIISVFIAGLIACSKTVQTLPTNSEPSYIKLFDVTNAVNEYSVLFSNSNNNVFLYTPSLDTKYNAVTGGNSTVRIEDFRKDTFVNSVTVTLTAGKYYSGFIYNQSDNLPGIGFVTDSLGVPAKNYSNVRILYAIYSGNTNNPVNLAMVSPADSLFSYNRSDVDFLRIPPLSAFTSVKSGNFALFVDGNQIADGINLVSGGNYSLVVAKVNDSTYHPVLYAH